MASSEPAKPLDAVESIVAHLTVVLNTERGDGHTHPELGVPLSLLLTRWPSSRTEVLREIKLTIERFEPRLKDVRVETVPGDGMRLAVMIYGLIDTTPLRIHTDLGPSGQTTVRVCADSEGAG